MAIVGSAHVRIDADTAPFSRALDALLSTLDKRMQKMGKTIGKSFNQSFEKEVDKSLERLSKSAKKAGKDVGKAYSEGLGKSAAEVIRASTSDVVAAAEDLGNSVNEALDKSGVDGFKAYEEHWAEYVELQRAQIAAMAENEARDARRKERLQESVNARLARLQWEELAKQVAATATTATRSGDTFIKIITSKMRMAGTSASGTWRDYFNTRTASGKEAKASADAFVLFFAKGSAGIAIIGTLVAALAQAAAGAVVLGAGLSSAAASAAVLGPVLGSVIQAGVVAKIAFGGVGDAIKAGLDPDKAEEFAKAMEKLSPAAQEFTRSMVAMNPQVKALKLAIQENFFQSFNEGAERLPETLASVENGLKRTSVAAGALGRDLLDVFNDRTTQPGLRFSSIIDQNNRFLEIFLRTTRNAGTGEQDTFFGQLGSAFIRIYNALEPLQMRFGSWVRSLATAADQATSTGQKTGAMVEFFNRAGERMAVVGSIIKNLAQALFGLGRAANESGSTDSMLGGIEQAAINLNNTIKANTEEIGQYFETARTNLQPLGQLLKDITMAFIDLGNTDSTGETFTTLQSAVPALKELLQVGVDSGPVFAEFVVSISDLFAALADTGAIEWLFKTLTLVSDVLTAIASNPIFQKIMLVAAPILGVAKALSLLVMAGRAVGLVFAGSIGKIFTFGRAVGGVAGKARTQGVSIGKSLGDGIKAGLSTSKSVVTTAATSLANFAISATKRVLRIKSPSGVFMTIGQQIVQGMVAGINAGKAQAAAAGAGLSSAASGAARTAAATATPAAAGAAASLGGAGAASSKMAGASKGVGALGGAMKGLAGAVGLLGRAFSFLLGPVGIILFTVLPLMIPLIKKLWDENEGFRNAVLGVWEAIKNAVGVVVTWFQTNVVPFLTAAWEAIKSGISALKPTFENIWNSILNVISVVSNAIQAVISFVWPFIQTYIQTYITIVWNVIQFYFNMIKTYIELVMNVVRSIIQVVWPFIQNIISTVMPIIATVVSTYFNIVKTVVTAVITFVQNLIQVAWPIIQNIISTVVTVVATVVSTYFNIVRTVISTVITFVQNLIQVAWPIIQNIISTAVTVISNVVSVYFNIVRSVITTVISVVSAAVQVGFNAIQSVVSFVMPIVQSVVSSTFNAIQGVWNNVLRPVVDAIKTAFSSLPGVFETVKGAIGRAWEGVVDVIKRPIRAVMDGINNWLITPLNKVTSVFGLDIQPISVPAFADGGPVRGPGGPRSDKILARLSDGEFVVTAEKYKKYRHIIDAIHQGKTPAVGGPADWVLDAVAGARNAASAVSDAVLDKLQEGASAALGFVVDKAVDPVIGRVRDFGFIGNFIGKIFDKFKVVIRDWGTKKDQERTVSADGSSIPPYLGPADGWTFPLAVRAPATTYPGHNFGAIDFPASSGTIIRAATSGVVGARIEGWGGGYGNHLILSHADAIQTVYAHLLSFLVRAGQMVRAGQAIGLVGSTGLSTGPHLHFEVRRAGSRIDSWSWLPSRGVALAKGGVVKATPGGVMALIGEAGKHERVEPLDSQGMSTRDRAIIAEVARNMGGGGGSGMNVRVFIGARELTDIVRYEITENETGNVRKLATGRRMYS